MSDSLLPYGLILPSFSVHGILQARILEWVTLPSSRGSSQPRDQNHVSYRSCIAGGFFTAEPPGKPKIKILGIYWFSCYMEGGTSLEGVGDVEMNFGIREAWIKFKLWLFLNVCPWENYLVSLYLCFSSVKPPLSIVVHLEIHLFIPVFIQSLNVYWTLAKCHSLSGHRDHSSEPKSLSSWSSRPTGGWTQAPNV